MLMLDSAQFDDLSASKWLVSTADTWWMDAVAMPVAFLQALGTALQKRMNKTTAAFSAVSLASVAFF